MVIHRKLMFGSPVARVLKNTKGDIAAYPGSSYRGPMSSSEVFFVFSSTQIGGYNGGEREFGSRLLSAILRLGGGSVLLQRVRNWHSLAR
jgi:hypothetical protein